MKNSLKNILQTAGQIYADYLITNLKSCKNLDLYEYLMYQAVLLDFCFDEYLNIQLN
jgi:hypothetical protein